MDVLSDILGSVRLNGTVYFKSDFSSPWGMTMDASNLVQFHIVVRGQCWLQMDGMSNPIPLVGGDIVAFPRGDAHWLSAHPDHECVSGQQVLRAYHNHHPMFQGDNVCTTLVCGHFEFDRNVDHPFMQDLPPFIHVRGTKRHQLTWLESATTLIINETNSGYPGATTVVDRLAEVLFIQLLRAYMLERKEPKGYLAALNDPQINKALQQIHARPQANWTLETLAQTVGMSRSSFAARFKQLVGITPMGYITSWRMQKAKELLADTNLPLMAISGRVGYASEAAFARAFKRHFNQNPGAMRKTLLENVPE